MEQDDHLFVHRRIEAAKRVVTLLQVHSSVHQCPNSQQLHLLLSHYPHMLLSHNLQLQSSVCEPAKQHAMHHGTHTTMTPHLESAGLWLVFQTLDVMNSSGRLPAATKSARPAPTTASLP